MTDSCAPFRPATLDLSGVSRTKDGGCILPLDFGAVYVVRPADRAKVRAVLTDSADGSETDAAAEANADGEFMVVPQKDGMTLTLCAPPESFTVERSAILTGHDTDGPWMDFAGQPALDGSDGSCADWRWTSDEVYERLYEPLRAAYPDYITRRSIGRDQSGKYECFAYFFTPRDYEATLFLTGGMHGEETDGYLALARLLTLVAEEDGSDPGLHLLRTRVRLVVVPMINVWAVSETHERRNSEGIDLNRDFGGHTQAETKNVVRLLEQIPDAAALIDFHCGSSMDLDLYYQFSIQAPNAPYVLKTVNHIYEVFRSRGIAHVPADLRMIPGKYEKNDKYLQGYAWNHSGVPTLVAEHLSRRFGEHTAQSLTMAVGCYGCFLIQTALFALEKGEQSL